MGRPVIIDDGGSVRIMWKQDRPGNRPAGKMDDLLEVNENPGQWVSNTSINAPGQDGRYNNAEIAWVEEGPGSGTQSFANFQRVVVSTDLNLNVELTRDPPTGRLTITIIKAGDEPIIECKYVDRKCSYTIVNCGSINQITCDGVSPITVPTVYKGVTIT